MAVVINGSTGITTPEMALDNGAADGGQVVLKSSGFNNWNIDNYSGNCRFYYNATELMRIDSSGNVGIGTSSPAAKLDVSVAGEALRLSGSTTLAYIRSVASGVNQWYVGSGGTAGLQFYTYTATPMTFNVNASEAMRIDSSGNVGIGTSSPVAKLTAITTSGATAFATGSGNQNFYVSADTAARYVTLASSGDLAGGFKFNVGNSEVMRIDLSGKLLVGTTNSYEQLTVGGFCSINNQQGVGGYASTLVTNCNGGSYYGIMVKNASTSSSNAMVFLNSSNSPNGAIAVTTTTTTYSTSSDYRLKENIQPMTGALASVTLLKPCTYTWKETGEAGQGFIAHELAEVVPQCVTGEKDAVNEDGSIKPQGIDTSFLVATLTAAIQEQQAIIEQLQADVATLKGNA